MDKVKITRKQAEVLETELKSSHIQGDKSKFVKMYVNLGDDDWEQGYPLTCLDKDTLIRALYIGYEVEETPEDKVLKYFKSLKSGEDWETANYQNACGVVMTLDLLNIKIEGIN
jgi:hypothetical protein